MSQPYSLRDYFAAAALTGTLANPETMRALAKSPGALDVRIAQTAYESADAMLAERHRTTAPRPPEELYEHKDYAKVEFVR